MFFVGSTPGRGSCARLINARCSINVLSQCVAQYISGLLMEIFIIIGFKLDTFYNINSQCDKYFEF